MSQWLNNPEGKHWATCDSRPDIVRGLTSSDAERSCQLFVQPSNKYALRLVLPNSILSSTMCIPTNHPFLKLFSSLKKAITRSRSPMPQSADTTSNELARPLSSDPPILITPSANIPVVDMVMSIPGTILLNFLPHIENQLLIKLNLQVIGSKSLWKERSSRCSQFYLSPLVCINPKPLSFIISNTDIDLLSPHQPISPPIAPVLNAGLVSVGTEMTVGCETPQSVC